MSGFLVVDDTGNLVDLHQQHEGTPESTPSGKGVIDFHTHPEDPYNFRKDSAIFADFPSFGDLFATINVATRSLPFNHRRVRETRREEIREYAQEVPEFFRRVRQERKGDETFEDAAQRVMLDDGIFEDLIHGRVFGDMRTSAIVTPSGFIIYCIPENVLARFHARRVDLALIDLRQVRSDLIWSGKARLRDVKRSAQVLNWERQHDNERVQQQMLFYLFVVVSTAYLLARLGKITSSQFFDAVKGDVGILLRAFGRLSSEEKQTFLRKFTKRMVTIGLIDPSAFKPKQRFASWTTESEMIDILVDAGKTDDLEPGGDPDVLQEADEAQTYLLRRAIPLLRGGTFQDFNFYPWSRYLPSSRIRGLLGGKDVSPM